MIDRFRSYLPVYTSAGNFLFIIANSLCFMFVIGECYLRIRARMEKLESPKAVRHTRKEERRYYLFCYFALLIAYLPVYLAYFPCLFNYDASYQISQTVGTYNTQQPLIHTLYLQFFYYIVGQNWLGSFTAGIACSCVVQALVFAAMLAYVHLFLYRVNMGRIFRMIVLGLSALLPFFPILAISTVKDTFFTGFIALFAVCLFYWENDPSYFKAKRHKALYFCSIAGIVLFRNNGIYAVLFALLFSGYSFLIRKKSLSFPVHTVLGLILSVLVSSGISSAVSAAPGDTQDMLSVPYHQMAYVYQLRESELSEEEKSVLKGMMPEIETFEPFLAESVCFTAKELKDLSKEEIGCYLNLFRKYPLEYIHAFMLKNMGYFYLWDTSHAQIYGTIPEERQGYIATNIIDGYGIEHTSLLPPLEKLYETLFTSNRYQNLFALRILCTPSTYFWLLTIFLFYSWDLRRNNMTSFAFLGGLILTYLAAPCVLIRFALSFIVCVPVLFPSVLYQKPLPD